MNWRKQKLIHGLNKNRPATQTEVHGLKQNSSTMQTEVKREPGKHKYTKDDLDRAVQAVLGGQSLGKASAQFNVPKETLRQAKMKHQS